MYKLFTYVMLGVLLAAPSYALEATAPITAIDGTISDSRYLKCASAVADASNINNAISALSINGGTLHLEGPCLINASVILKTDVLLSCSEGTVLKANQALAGGMLIADNASGTNKVIKNAGVENCQFDMDDKNNGTSGFSAIYMAGTNIGDPAIYVSAPTINTNRTKIENFTVRNVKIYDTSIAVNDHTTGITIDCGGRWDWDDGYRDSCLTVDNVHIEFDGMCEREVGGNRVACTLPSDCVTDANDFCTSDSDNTTVGIKSWGYGDVRISDSSVKNATSYGFQIMNMESNYFDGNTVTGGDGSTGYASEVVGPGYCLNSITTYCKYDPYTTLSGNSCTTGYCLPGTNGNPVKAGGYVNTRDFFADSSFEAREGGTQAQLEESDHVQIRNAVGFVANKGIHASKFTGLRWTLRGKGHTGIKLPGTGHLTNASGRIAAYYDANGQLYNRHVDPGASSIIEQSYFEGGKKGVSSSSKNIINVRIYDNLFFGGWDAIEMNTGWHVVGNTINWMTGRPLKDGSGGNGTKPSPGGAVLLGPLGTSLCTSHSVFVGNSLHTSGTISSTAAGSPSLIRTQYSSALCVNDSSGELEASCTFSGQNVCVNNYCSPQSSNAGDYCTANGDCTAHAACAEGRTCTVDTTQCRDITITGNMVSFVVNQSDPEWQGNSAALDLGLLGTQSEAAYQSAANLRDIVIGDNFFQQGAAKSTSSIGLPPAAHKPPILKSLEIFNNSTKGYPVKNWVTGYGGSNVRTLTAGVDEMVMPPSNASAAACTADGGTFSSPDCQGEKTGELVLSPQGYSVFASEVGNCTSEGMNRCINGECNDLSQNEGDTCSNQDNQPFASSDCTALADAPAKACDSVASMAYGQSCDTVADCPGAGYVGTSNARVVIDGGVNTRRSNDGEAYSKPIQVSNLEFEHAGTLILEDNNASSLGIGPENSATTLIDQMILLDTTNSAEKVKFRKAVELPGFVSQFGDSSTAFVFNTNCGTQCTDIGGNCNGTTDTCTLPVNSGHGGDGKLAVSGVYEFGDVTLGVGKTLKLAEAGTISTDNCVKAYGQNLIIKSTGNMTIKGTIDVSGLGSCGAGNTAARAAGSGHAGTATQAGAAGTPGVEDAVTGENGGNGGSAFLCGNTQAGCVLTYSPIRGGAISGLYSFFGGAGGKSNSSGSAATPDAILGAGSWTSSLGGAGGGSAFCDNTPNNTASTRGGGGLVLSASGNIDLSNVNSRLKTHGQNTSLLKDKDNATGGGGTIVLQTLRGSITDHGAAYETAGGTQTGAAECSNSATTEQSGVGGYGAIIKIDLDG